MASGGLEAERGDAARRHRARRSACAASPARPAAYRRTARSRRRGAAPAPDAPPARRRPVPACVACSKISMPGRHLRRLGPHRLHARRHHQGQLGCAGRAARWPARAPASSGRRCACSTLGSRRAHAHALAGGQNDDQKRVLGHVGDRVVLQVPRVGQDRCHATCMPGQCDLVDLLHMINSACAAICGPNATPVWQLRAHVHNPVPGSRAPRVDRTPLPFDTVLDDSDRARPASARAIRWHFNQTRTLLVMAAQASHHAPSGRFIRAYLVMWGLLAAGGLTYLASLAWQPELFSPAQRPQMAEPDPGVQAANQALAEVGTVRQRRDRDAEGPGPASRTRSSQREARGEGGAGAPCRARGARHDDGGDPRRPGDAGAGARADRDDGEGAGEPRRPRPRSARTAPSRHVRPPTSSPSPRRPRRRRCRPSSPRRKHPGSSRPRSRPAASSRRRHHLRGARGDAGASRPSPCSSPPGRRSTRCA